MISSPERSPWHQMALPFLWTTAVVALLLLGHTHYLYSDLLSSQVFSAGQVVLLLIYNFPAVLVAALPTGYAFAVFHTLGCWVPVPGESPPPVGSRPPMALLRGALIGALGLSLVILVLNEALVPRTNAAAIGYVRQVLQVEDRPGQPTPPEMNLGTLHRYLREQAASGDVKPALRVDYHLKLALPLAPLFLSLVVAPLSLWFKRWCARVSIPLTVILSVSYFLELVLGRKLANQGTLSPVLGAWLPNLVFAVLGLIVFPLVSRSSEK